MTKKKVGGRTAKADTAEAQAKRFAKAKKELEKDREREELRKLARAKAIEEGLNPDDAEVTEDVEESYQLLKDMREVYKNVGGKEKLQERIDANPRAFESMIKELIKMELQLHKSDLEAKGRGAGEGRAIYVIIEGLHDDPTLKKEPEKVAPLLNVDMTEVLNPAAEQDKLYEQLGECDLTPAAEEW